MMEPIDCDDNRTQNHVIVNLVSLGHIMILTRV